MTNFNIGCNFDFFLLTEIAKLNNKYSDNKVTEFYGSLRRSISGLPTARPDFRIPGIGIHNAKEFIKMCHDVGIKFNYTLNSPLSDYWFRNKEENYDYIFKVLNDLNVDIITLSHPLAIEYFVKYTNFNIEISTILEVQNIDSIIDYCEYAQVKKICISITKNRDFRFLRNLAKTFFVDEIEILANEFCSVSGIPCQNYYRKSCYEIHALGGNPDHLHNGYPMEWCSKSRNENPESWIKANVIFPHDLHYYKELGFKKFKISGRTLPTEFILKTAEAYLSEGKICNDNILALWGHVDNIKRRDLMVLPDINISLEKLKQKDFLKFFIKKSVSCDDVECNICSFCKKMFEECVVK